MEPGEALSTASQIAVALAGFAGVAANFIFHLFATLGWGAILLQLCNVALLGAFWPFFTGIVVQLIGAMFQFARMILQPPE